MSADRSALSVAAHRWMAWLRRRLPLLRHPRGFYLLCLAVLCERWAALILASSVVLMLCERYGYARSDALRLAGMFNAASYLATLPGGLVVDRALGSRRSLAIGITLLTLGYAMLTLPNRDALWLAVATLLLGHALFKPSTQTVMVRLYEPHDRRLDAAQIACYLVANVGGAAGSLCAGLLESKRDYRFAFLFAAAGLLLGCAVVFVGNNQITLRPKWPVSTANAGPIQNMLPPRQRTKIIVGLTLAMTMYTISFGQVEGSLLLWAQDRTDRAVVGYTVPAAWFVGLPALLVLLLAPLQLALLPQLQHRFSTPRLVAMGLVATALGFAVLLPPALLFPGQRVSMLWLIACMTLIVIGELLIAPLGLSLLLRLAPQRFVGVVVGAWYVAGACGCWLAGELGAFWMK